MDKGAINNTAARAASENYEVNSQVDLSSCISTIKITTKLQDS